MITENITKRTHVAGVFFAVAQVSQGRSRTSFMLLRWLHTPCEM